MSTTTTLRGIVRRITYRGRDGFVIARIAPIDSEGGHADPDAEDVPIKGSMHEVVEGEEVELHGRWQVDARYGRQFAFSDGRQVTPSSEKGAAAWLAGHLPGVGDVTAQRLVEAYGRGERGVEGVWDVLSAGTPDEAIERVVADKTIRRAAAEMAIPAYREHAGMVRVSAWLRKLPGFGARNAAKVLAAWGAQARGRIEADPYSLTEIEGFAFRTADRVASGLGTPTNHPGRVKAAIMHTVVEAAESEGHCYLPMAGKGGLLERLRKLGVEEPAARSMVASFGQGAPGWLEALGAETAGRVWIEVEGEGDEARVALGALAKAEREVVAMLERRLGQ